MSENNLLNFPTKMVKTPESVPSPEGVMEKIKERKAEDINDISQMIQVEIFDLLEELGFPVTDDAFFDACFIAETIRSFISKRYGTEHPFHSFSQNIFRADENDPTKVYFLSPEFACIEKIKDEEKPV